MGECMSRLATIENSKMFPPRIVLYGVEGSGKSTFGTTFPKPIFIQTEKGLRTIDCPRFPYSETYIDVMLNLDALIADSHEYQALIIDSLSGMEKRIHEHIALVNHVEMIDEIGWQKGYKFANKLWTDFLNKLDLLVEQRSMIVVCLAHPVIQEFNAPDAESYNTYSIKLHKEAVPIVKEWADALLFLNYITYTSKIKSGQKEKVVGTGVGERMIYTQKRPAFDAKNRYNLPLEILLEEGHGWDLLKPYVFKKVVKELPNAAT
jgi:hypothetical protein